MKIKKICGAVLLMSALLMSACGPKPAPSSNPSSEPDQSQPSSQGGGDSSQGGGGQSSQGGGDSSQGGGDSSQGGDSGSTDPVKAVNITESVLVNEDGKVYVKVTGTQENHSAAEFKWAWGVKENGENGAFVDGSAEPAATDFAAATFDANNQFVLKYCLTDIEALASGKFYRIYGGTPATYADIAFTNNETAARDASRNYYLRQDQNYSVVFDSVQPIEFKLATVVDVAQADLPTGVTNAGAYLKIGGANSAGLTMDTINGWNEAGKIAGNFQRCIGGYTLHNHVAEERFWKIEGDNVFFYLYIGWMAVGEGWQTHFDCVSGNAGANLQFDDVVLTGDIEYKVGDYVYRVYADKSKGSSERDFYGCVGVTKEKWVDPTVHVHAYPDDADAEYAAGEGYIATKAYNCTGTCNTSALRWSALDFDETLSSGTTLVKVNGSQENNAVKTGNAENDGGQGNANPAQSTGNHYVYKVKVSSAVAAAGLAFQIYSRSSDLQVFKSQDNDGKRGNYYDEATQTFTAAPARYGVRVNGQEVYFDETLLAEEAATPKNSLVWRDFPLNSFALNEGVNTIDVYSMGGYSQAGILNFQLTGLPKVAITHRHTLGDWQHDDNNHWKECSADDCSSPAHTHFQEAAHEWGDPVVVPTTETAQGSETYTCTVCGATKVVKTPVLAFHTWDEATMKAGLTKDPTKIVEKEFADGTKMLKSNTLTSGETCTITYNNTGEAKTVTFRMLITIKTSNNDRGSGFWYHDNNKDTPKEKTIITVNGNKVTPPAAADDINFKKIGCTVDDTMADDSGKLAIPVWADICTINLQNGENTIVLTVSDTNYSYFYGGAALANIVA